jgi:hypothetical protein
VATSTVINDGLQGMDWSFGMEMKIWTWKVHFCFVENGKQQMRPRQMDNSNNNNKNVLQRIPKMANVNEWMKGSNIKIKGVC